MPCRTRRYNVALIQMGHTQVHNHWSAVKMGFIHNDKAMDQRERTKHMDLLYFSLLLLVYMHGVCV